MNILLLDGGKEFGHSHGELNHTLHKKAKEVLTALGHNVKETVIDSGYCSRSRILGNVTAKSENSEKSVISHFKRILTANFEKIKRHLN